MRVDAFTNKSPKIKGWVARDKEGVLCFHYEKPYRLKNVWESTEDFEDRKQIVLEFEPNRYFPNLKWEDEPLKVELTINATPDVIKVNELESLDEAADEQARSFGYMSEDYEYKENVESFKAGAEWMAEQGETMEGSLCYGPHLQKVIVFLEDCPKMWEGRTMDVIVQIRKKEESK